MIGIINGTDYGKGHFYKSKKICGTEWEKYTISVSVVEEVQDEILVCLRTIVDDTHGSMVVHFRNCYMQVL